MLALLARLLTAANHPGDLSTLAQARHTATADGGRPRLVREAADRALIALEGLAGELGHDPAQLRVSRVTFAHDATQAAQRDVPEVLLAVMDGAAKRGVLPRAFVHLSLLAADATEQFDVLVCLGTALDELPGRRTDDRCLFAASVRRLADEEAEPFVDAASLAEARGRLDGEHRGGGGVLVAA